MAGLMAEQLTHSIIGCAIEVHRSLGPGLLESAYEECLAREFDHTNLSYQRQLPVPLMYRGRPVDTAYRLDFLVHNTVVVEAKCVEKLVPIHEAQLMTYLRITGKSVGLLINFNVPLLRDGIVRRVL